MEKRIIFKRNGRKAHEDHAEEIQAEVFDHSELATIEVRDIKQYLVDEYERADELCKKNKLLEQQLDEADEIDLKYQAALVTLDEYKQRLQKQHLEIRDLESKVRNQKEQIKQELEKCNDMQIAMHRMDGIPLIESVINACLEATSAIKATSAGNISKSLVWDALHHVESEQMEAQRKSKVGA